MATIENTTVVDPSLVPTETSTGPTATSTDQPVAGPGVTSVPFAPPILIAEPADNPSGPVAADAPVAGPGVDLTPPLVDRAREVARVETPTMRSDTPPAAVATPLILLVVAIGLVTAFLFLDRSR